MFNTHTIVCTQVVDNEHAPKVYTTCLLIMLPCQIPKCEGERVQYQ